MQDRLTMTIADRLRQQATDMTPAERKIARILFASAMVAGLETVAGLADRAAVSGPSVIRLTSKLGYASYPEFQRALREELEARRTGPLSLAQRAQPAVDRDDLLANCRDKFQAALDSSFARMSPADFAATIDILSDLKSQIFLTGGRFSHLIAEMLYLHLFQMRPGAHLLAGGLQARKDQLLNLGRGSVLVVYDVRRYQADTVELARQAHRRGARIVLITDPWESPIAEIADHVLVADVGSPSPFDTMVPAFALTEALIAGIMQRLGRKALGRIEDLEGLREGFEFLEGGRVGGEKRP